MGRREHATNIALEVLDASPVVCLRWLPAPPWPMRYVSRNVKQWGYDPGRLLRRRTGLLGLLHPDDAGRVARELEGYIANGLSSFIQEFRLLTATRESLWVECRTIARRDAGGRVTHLDALLTDMSQRRAQQEATQAALETQRQLNKRLEEAHNQLLQAEKMASIGQLAAGVAHELNNPIGFVHSNMGSLEVYLRDLMALLDAYEATFAEANIPPALRARVAEEKARIDLDYLRRDIIDLLHESKDGLARVRKIVQDLKSFARTGEHDWLEADLHEGIDSTLNIVWNELKYKCTVKKDYADLPPVVCIPSQINQVIMNLLVNAGQAIDTHGEITVRTRRCGAESVAFEVSDTGRGIPPEHLNRIFEPFFTTKPVGTGTGLGLSLSYGIIERHHGRIEVSSQPGAGTTFRVTLPIRQPPGATAPPAAPEAA